jgi:hypothetical protein
MGVRCALALRRDRRCAQRRALGTNSRRATARRPPGWRTAQFRGQPPAAFDLESWDGSEGVDAHYVREDGPPLVEEEGRTVWRYVLNAPMTEHGQRPESAVPTTIERHGQAVAHGR